MSGSFSFKIGAPPPGGQRPPPSRAPGSGSRAYHHSNNDEDDSSDDDAFAKKRHDEEITGFGAGGATSKVKAKKEAPLAIPSLANKDWRAEATKNRRPKRGMYVPDAVGSMRVGGPAPGAAGADGSQGGLGTRDVMNDVEVVGGLAMPPARKEDKAEVERGDGQEAMETEGAPPPPEPTPAAPETDEQRALRELLSGQDSSSSAQPAELAAIHSAHDTFQSGPQDETSAFRSDVLTRPDAPDLDAYARVPVGQFGAALLRGMGWKEGTAASRTGRAGPTEAYVPKSRPAMLGIGAKPMKEVLGEEKGKDGRPVRRERAGDMRFVPLVKKAREGGSGASVSRMGRGQADEDRVQGPGPGLTHLSGSPNSQTPVGAITNGSSPAPSSSRGDSDRRDDRPRDRERDRDSHRSSDRDRDSGHRSRSHRERSRSPRREDRDRYRSDRDRDSGRSSRREEERREGGRGEREYRERERGEGSDRRDRDRDNRDRERDRDYRDRDRREDRRDEGRRY